MMKDGKQYNAERQPQSNAPQNGGKFGDTYKSQSQCIALGKNKGTRPGMVTICYVGSIARKLHVLTPIMVGSARSIRAMGSKSDHYENKAIQFTISVVPIRAYAH